MSIESHESYGSAEHRESENDIESILEKAEIINSYSLEGDHTYMQMVEFKGGLRGLFRPEIDAGESEAGGSDDPQAILERFKQKLRSDLELMSFEIDRLLNFNLVPSIARRDVRGQKGVVQHYIEEARPAKLFGKSWDELVDNSELIKGAVFDYLIDAKDRNTGNFLVDPISNKIWLIDNDFFMLMNPGGIPSDIRFRAERRGLFDISGFDDIKSGLNELVSKIDSLTVKLNPELAEELQAIKQRALRLLGDNKIPRQEYLA